jgi:methionyl aminopeptidase
MSKVVQHGKWKFDYNPGKFVYGIDSTTVEDYYFRYDGAAVLDEKLSDYRKAAVIHKLVRNDIFKKIHEGVKYSDLVEEATNSLNRYVSVNEGGFAFPLGISVNEIIAHDTAMINDDRFLNKNDVVKIDLGIHINGCIIDSAFTTIVDGDEKTKQYYDPLLQASKDATFTGICLSGADARVYEISESIKEVIESYELEDGTQVVAVHGLGGHDILPYKVHGKKLVLCAPHKSQEGVMMKEGEFYAIETYASTGDGNCKMKSIEQCNHFMINESIKMTSKMKSNPVIEWEQSKNNNLPFTQLWVKDINKIQKHMNEGVRNRSIIAFPPVADRKGSRTAQFEHTIHIRDGGVEIFSLGEDC